MRDRLIEFLSGKSIDTKADVEYVADYLLENGVIVPPCKVGDTVYLLISGFDFVAEGKVKSITKYDADIAVVIFVHGYFEQRRVVKDFGKSVFFTKEEAVETWNTLMLKEKE